jgi:hypothetical protein
MNCLRLQRTPHRVDDLPEPSPSASAIPALVYALMRVGAALYIDCHAKA